MAKQYEYGVAWEGNVTKKGIKMVRVFPDQKSAEEERAKCGRGYKVFKREVAPWEEVKKLKFDFPEMKHITCRNVKVAKIETYKESKAEMKARAECGDWMFPCKSYLYDDIKAGLENAICEVLGLKACKVWYFDTGIVEYDRTEGK